MKILNHKMSKVVVSCLLVMAMLMCTCVTAFADSYSEWKYHSGYQINYKYRARLQVFTFGIYSTVYVQSTNNAPILPGYVGTDAMLYRSNGDLVAYTGMHYNESSSPTISRYTSSTQSGTFYGQSLVSLAVSYTNGNYNYALDHTSQTAYQSYPQSKGNSDELDFKDLSYEVNARGETYGSGILADVLGVYPDLLSAIGDNGNKGYIRFDDLVYTPTSPEDALEYSKNIEGTSVPVYDLNGNIIDYLTASSAENDVVKLDK